MICDTSALLAAFAPDQTRHAECASVLMAAGKRLVPALVLVEVDQLLRRVLGGAVATRAIEELAGPAFQMIPLHRQTLDTARQVMSVTDLDLVDATIVASAKEMRTIELFTLDESRFRRVRALNGLPFRLLPVDLDL